MVTSVLEKNMSEPIIRTKMVTAENFATQKLLPIAVSLEPLPLMNQYRMAELERGHHLFRECYLRFVRVNLLHLIELQMK